MLRETGDYLASGFVAMAHRGGALLPANLGIENTLVAFGNAAQLGYHYLETDVHVTRDGVAVAFHDADLMRVSDRPEKLAQLSWEEIRELRVGGREPIPSVAELLESFPNHRFNFDLKVGSAIRPLISLIERFGAHSRVCVGSFSQSRIKKFRKLMPQVATAASPASSGLLAVGLANIGRRRSSTVFQVPMFHCVGKLKIPLVSPIRIRAVHRAGCKIHVWTVDDPLVMHDLLDWGVDGIITDRPDLLKDVLQARGIWSTRGGT